MVRFHHQHFTLQLSAQWNVYLFIFSTSLAFCFFRHFPSSFNIFVFFLSFYFYLFFSFSACLSPVLYFILPFLSFSFSVFFLYFFIKYSFFLFFFSFFTGFVCLYFFFFPDCLCYSFFLSFISQSLFLSHSFFISVFISPFSLSVMWDVSSFSPSSCMYAWRCFCNRK